MACFVDKRTGDVVSVPTDDMKFYDQVEEWDFLDKGEYETGVAPEDRTWVPKYFLKKLSEFTGRMSALKAAYEIEKREIVNLEKALVWRYQDEVQAQADELLEKQGGKKKSVNTTYGKLGYRKDTKIQLAKDERETIAWCLENEAEGAVKAEYSILKSNLPRGEEIPGVTWPEGDVFFARPAK